MLDDTPINVTLSVAQLSYAMGAIRKVLKKRERELSKSEFVPPPGSLDLNEAKIPKLREMLVTLGNIQVDVRLPAGQLGLAASATRLLLKEHDKFGSRTDDASLREAEALLSEALAEHLAATVKFPCQRCDHFSGMCPNLPNSTVYECILGEKR